MSIIDGNNNPVAQLLGKKFSEADKNEDGSLGRLEFGAFNETLKHGIATDAHGRPSFDYFTKMDHDKDGAVTREEALSTGVLLPASMTAGAGFMAHILAQEEAQASAGEVSAESAAKRKSAVDEFMEYMEMTPAERLFYKMLAEEGVTKEEFEAMSPADQAKLRDKIEQKIRTRMEAEMQEEMQKALNPA